MASAFKTSRVSIGTVWDRTTAVLSGRGQVIASVAILTLFVPAVVQSAVTLFASDYARGLASGFVALVAAFLSIWGGLAIIALATHPATDRPTAQRVASARLWPVIGVSIVIGLILLVLVLPPVIALAATGFDFQAASTAAANNTPALMPAPAGSASLFIAIYVIGLIVLSFWVSARLMLINAVLVNERVGLGAIRRSIALTRGMTWRLIGVLLLFGIVFGVAVLASQAVVGLVFRLILGADRIALSLFLGGIAGAAASTAMMVVAYVFTAQLYAATNEKS